MKKLISILLIASISSISLANADESYNGWTPELIQKTFPEFLKSKEKDYAACLLNSLVSNYTYKAFVAMTKNHNGREAINTALATCGFEPSQKEYKAKMDNGFHEFVSGWANGTEKIEVEMPQLNGNNSLGIEYYFTWVTSYGEQKTEIYYCWIGDAQGYASDEGSFSCTKDY